MDTGIFEHLNAGGFLSDISISKIKAQKERQLFSLHWEIKTILYLGVLLLSGGLGVLIYKNIDSIGHQVILIFISLVCAGSFTYCLKTGLSFSRGKISSPNSFFDYIVLLGCCTFITLVAYLQFQYHLFGNRYGLATFFPMMVLFFSAYYFDHIGILSMAITNLAGWLGITVTPLEILDSNDFNESTLIFTGIALGVSLLCVAIITRKKNFKQHFEFTYQNFGTHILLISAIAAMIQFENLYLLCFLLLSGVVYYFYSRAMANKSFYFILIITLYTYVALSYIVLKLIDSAGDFGIMAIYLGFFYFIASGIALVLFLIRSNKILKRHDSIQ